MITRYVGKPCQIEKQFREIIEENFQTCENLRLFPIFSFHISGFDCTGTAGAKGKRSASSEGGYAISHPFLANLDNLSPSLFCHHDLGVGRGGGENEEDADYE